MNPVRCSDEVFRHFVEKRGVDGDGDIEAIALFAFALVEKDRIDWLDHRIGQSLSPPTASETEQWYLALPEAYFEKQERLAADWFAAFGRMLLADEFEAGKRRAVARAVGELQRAVETSHDKIASRIDDRTKFRDQFWIGNLVGLTSNLVFTLLILLFAFYVATDFSFVAWVKTFFASGKPN